MDVSFKTPERKTAPDGSPFFDVLLQTPYILPISLDFDGRRYIPTSAFQTALEPIVRTLLQAIAQTPTLFRTPPTFRSLQAITPVWGAVVVGDTLQWNLEGGGALPLPTDSRPAKVVLALRGVQITRLRILPLWDISTVQPTADPSPDLIDFVFGEPSDLEDVAANIPDARSVVSTDSIETDGNDLVFELHDPNKEKREFKAHVRSLLRIATEARAKADQALEHFCEEYDLSEGESDFSDADD